MAHRSIIKRGNILFFCLLFMLAAVNPAAALSEADVEMPDLSRLEEVVSKLDITGTIETYAKIQDAYYTPLDAVSGDRNGANYRDDQIFRARLRLNFTYGLPTDEWFGLVQFDLDANDPDPEDEDSSVPNDNQSEDEFDLDSAFVMYRPFEVEGGRPFGIKLGVVPVLATANAAYFHYYTGDIEDDFILYTATALPEVPGVDLDFHISEGTGIGVTYARGVDDASEIAAFTQSDSTENWVIWAEAKEFGFTWNGAVQFVDGEAFPSDLHVTDSGNQYFSYEQKYSHTVGNTFLSYRFDLGPIGIMPGIGYEVVDGEQVPTTAGGQDRDIKIENYQVGLNLFTNFFDIPGKFSILYTESDTDDFNGIGILPSGTINGAIDQALVANAGVPAGTWTAIAPPVLDEGSSEAGLFVAGIDWDLHVEYGFDISDSVRIGFFYHMLETRDIDPITPGTVRAQLAKGDTEAALAQATGGGIVGQATADAILNGVADGVAQQLAPVRQQFEWTDTQSYGIFCKLFF